MAFLRHLLTASAIVLSSLSAQEVEKKKPCPVPNCMWEWAYFQDLTVDHDRYPGWDPRALNEEVYEVHFDRQSLNERIMQQFYLAYVVHRMGNVETSREVFQVIDRLVEQELSSRSTEGSWRLSEHQEEHQDHCMEE